MSLFPFPRDDNGKALIGMGTQTVTYRFADVPFSGNQIFVPIDIKGAMIHIEGATPLAAFSGTASGSQWAYLTSDGISLGDVPMALATSGVLFEVAAPVSGTTVDVSVFGWR